MQDDGNVGLSKQAAEEYTQALAQIFGGGWRLVLSAERMGIPKALGMTTRLWVDQRLGGYQQLPAPERRMAVQELVEAEGLSENNAAEVLGVSRMTVRADRGKRRPVVQSPAPVENESVPEPVQIVQVEADPCAARIEALEVRLARANAWREAVLHACREVMADQ